jgi:ribonuclease HI
MRTNQATQINNSTASTSNQHNQDTQTDSDNTVVIHCDGAGARPDGKGSGFAWIQPHTGERYVERVDGLTNNQAEYRALISALNSIADGSVARVFTDSQVMCSQVVGDYKVRNAELAELLLQVRDVIKRKQLSVGIHWIPRQKNLAGKLL